MTFAVIELSDEGMPGMYRDEPAVIGHYKTTDQAIAACNDLREKNPDRVFHWLMLPKAK